MAMASSSVNKKYQTSSIHTLEGGSGKWLVKSGSWNKRRTTHNNFVSSSLDIDNTYGVRTDKTARAGFSAELSGLWK